jgi:hypothetical protein
MIKKSLKILKVLVAGLMSLVSLFILYQLIMYLTTPVYSFSRPEPFGGEKWYNPYAGMDSTHWRKANFHFHTREWYGITAGRDNTEEQFWKTYKMLKYDVPCISNYMSINRYNQDSSFYIPVYEHGYGVRKKHQILIGANSVLWRDYSFFQNLSIKQHILDLLRPTSEIVAIAHPDWENGYSLKDMADLSNYDLVEALDRNWRSIPQWDAALSAGRPVYILADDDAHDINNPYQIGICATYINAAEMTTGNLIESLKNGKSFGAELYMSEGDSFEEKAFRAGRVPVVNAVEIHGDSLNIRLSEKAISVVFIGQGGKPMNRIIYTDNAWYRLQPGDTYIRARVLFFNKYHGPGTIFYLNPVFRYNGERPYNKLTAEINFERTWIFRIMGFGSIALIIAAVIKAGNLRRKKSISDE